ncbi:protein kinase domain-containing protein [Piscirickettsia litoralis]|uniref:Protein kinase domain-containing protein n=1 Tax=Piscirickettsia litoralis TaxID=1891921 RepID=A0ABX2ZWY2_9GAMM|nr:protein kinase family protein [Piscirickettsia litoralis]ODN40993.1 hypothetical protein BGC07_18740 [Piscirickettsia litoralis]
MPKVTWVPQDERTAEEQEAAEWRVVERYLGKHPGTEIHPSHSKRTTLIDPETGRSVYLTHRYLRGADGEIFVKSNGRALGKGSFGEVTFGQTKDGQMWAIKESSKNPRGSRESEIAHDLGKAKKRAFRNESKHYQVYRFLGTPLDKYLQQNDLSEEQQYDLAIKMARAVHHLHAGTYSQSGIKYAHLDLKPENFCIDDQGDIHLIDYGLSEELSGNLECYKGTRIYFPVQVGDKKEFYDVFALKRSIYLPDNFLSYNKSSPGNPAYDKISYNDVFPIKSKWEFLDTSDGKLKAGKAINIVAFLILAKFDLYSAANVQKITDNPEQFDENYQRLEKLGLHQREYVKEVLDNPKGFEDNYQRLEGLGLNKREYVKKVLDNPTLINKFEEHKDKFLTLNNFELNEPKYVEEVLKSPKEFEDNYQRLKGLGLNKREYVKKVLDNPTLINKFEEHKDKFLTLNNLGLNEREYVKKVLDDPTLINKFEKHKDKFLTLNNFELNEPKYVEEVLKSPKEFEDNYQRLEKLGLHQQEYVKKVLDNPKQFDENYRRLEKLGLHQQEYVKKVLDNPKQFDENYRRLERLGLNEPEYVKKVLDNPKQFDENYRRLEKLRLCQGECVKKLLKNLKQFDENYRCLERLGLNKREYVKEILKNPKQFDENYRRLERLGLNEAEYVEGVLDNPKRFEGNYQRLQTIKDEIESTWSLLNRRFLGQTREVDLCKYYPSYQKKVMNLSFNTLMLLNDTFSSQWVREQLATHEKSLLSESNLEDAYTTFGKFSRHVMRVSSNSIFEAGMGMGYIRNKEKMNITTSQKLFLFFSQMASADKAMQTTCNISRVLEN